jgi:NAD(P)-dependent dehydrogenase (short-subunit alcohol dehydrogenase family)
MLGTKHAIRAMVETGGGAIINWSSAGGINGSPMPVGIYSASKAGVISFTKQAAIEYGARNIRGNAICPGLTVTEMIGGRESVERFPGLVQGSPMRRAGEPEEVAELACFLASDRAPFINGAIIPIDGGLTATTP